jgi:hypothetical protein
VSEFWTGPQGSWTFADLGPGTHTFRAVFEGTQTQPPGESAVITQVVKKAASILTFEHGSGDQLVVYSGQNPIRMVLRRNDGGTLGGNVHLWSGSDQGLVIHGSVSGPAITIQSVYAMPAGTYCRVHWRAGSGIWNSAVTASPSWSEPQAPVNVPYTVFIEVYTSGHQLVVKSNTEVVMRTSFTDDPLPVRTRIKARHLTELVEAVNMMRAAAGLLPVDVLGIAPGARIRSAHLLQIQTAVNDARRALGGDAVAFSGGLDARTRIKAGRLLETREAIR